MQQRQIGDVQVSAIGLGEMPLSIEGRPDEARAMATVHASLDAGVTIIDTADAYCLNAGEHGHGERLVATALATYGGDASEVLVATKGGHLRPGDGSWTGERPAGVHQAGVRGLAEGARRGGDRPLPVPPPGPVRPLRRLGGRRGRAAGRGQDPAWPASPTPPWPRSTRPSAILGGRLASVQNEFSLRFRSSEDELRHCEELGIAFIPWSPLGGIGNADQIERDHPAVAELAREQGVTPQQLTLAWMLAKGDRVVPIPGSSRPETARASAAAADIRLSRRTRSPAWTPA